VFGGDHVTCYMGAMWMQVSTWMLRFGVGPAVGVFTSFLHELFCNEYYEQLIFVVIKCRMDFIIGELK